MIHVVDQGILPHRRGRGAFIPFITPLSDGSFIAAQQVGPELGSRDHVIELLRSRDGREWDSDGFLEVDENDASVGYQSIQVYEISPSLRMMRASRFLRTGPGRDSRCNGKPVARIHHGGQCERGPQQYGPGGLVAKRSGCFLTGGKARPSAYQDAFSQVVRISVYGGNHKN